MYPMSTWGTILMQEAADSHREKTNLELINWLIDWIDWIDLLLDQWLIFCHAFMHITQYFTTNIKLWIPWKLIIYEVYNMILLIYW